jgi:phosphate uptake regulator
MWKELINIWKSDSLLNQAWDRSYESINISREIFLEAVRILRESDDAEINMEIRKKDKLINKYEQEVRRKVMTHCTMQGPSSLPSGMVLISIIIDVERLGDYAKNIMDLAADHPQRLYVPVYEENLTEIETDIKRAFAETIHVLREHDVDKARELIATHKTEVRRICDQILSNLVQGKVKEISQSDSTALALYARYLKRISAHLNNMITSVVNPFDRIGFKEKKKT